MRSWVLLLLLAALLAARLRLGGAEDDPLPASLVDLLRNSPISSVDDLKLLLLQETDAIEEDEDEHDLLTNHTHGRYSRSLVEAQPAQQAACKVRTEVMEVTRSMLDRRNANFLLWPPCVEVQRCSGCCNTRLLQCVPTVTSSRYLQVIKIQYINRKAHYDKAVISVEDHVTCRCQPPSSSSSSSSSSVPVPRSSTQSYPNPPPPPPQQPPLSSHRPVHPAPPKTHTSKADLHRHDDLKHNQQRFHSEEREPVGRQWQQGSYTQLVHWTQPRLHQMPPQVHQTPSQVHQTPSLGHQTSSQVHHTPSQGHQAPSQVHQTPSLGHQTPSQGHQTPSQVHQTPSQVHQTPSLGHQTPSQGHQTPSQVHQTPSQVHQTPSQVHQTPSQVHQTPSQGHQTPSQGHQTPSQGHQTPSQVHQTPSLGHQTPSQGHQTPSQVHQTPSQGQTGGHQVWPSEARAEHSIMGTTQQQVGHGSGYDGSREEAGGGKGHHPDHSRRHHQHHYPQQYNHGDDQDMRTQYRLNAAQSDSAAPPVGPTRPSPAAEVPPPPPTAHRDSVTGPQNAEVTHHKQTETAAASQKEGNAREESGSANSGDSAGAEPANQEKEKNSRVTSEDGRFTEEERRQKLLEMVQKEPEKPTLLHPHHPQQRLKPTVVSSVAPMSASARHAPFRPATPRRRRKHRKRISKAAMRAMIM